MEAGEAKGPRDFRPITLQEGVLWVYDIKAAQSQPSYPVRLHGCGSSCVQQPQEMLSLLNSFALNPVTPKSSQRGFLTGLCEPRLLPPGGFSSWGRSISPAHSLHDRLCFASSLISPLLDRVQWVSGLKLIP